MKKFAALVMALVLLCSVCAVAESTETITIGTYVLTPNGFTCSSNSETDLDIYFTDTDVIANIQYMSYESLDISYSDFAVIGLTDDYAIADMFVDAIASEDMLASIEKENVEFSDISGVLYYGLLTESYDSVNYCGLILVDENAIFSVLCIGIDADETSESLRASLDTFLACLSVAGGEAATSTSPVAVGSIGSLLSNSVSGSETSDGDDAADTDESSVDVETIELDDDIYVESETVMLGSHTIYTPIDWEFYSSADNQLIYTCGDTMIMVGIYEFDDPSIMESALAMDNSTLAELLKSGTVEGLSGIGLDTSAFSFQEIRYSLAGDSPIIRFDGDASALASGYYLTGATMLTDVDMAMIMILSTSSSAESTDTDLILWDAIALFCD